MVLGILNPITKPIGDLLDDLGGIIPIVGGGGPGNAGTIIDTIEDLLGNSGGGDSTKLPLLGNLFNNGLIGGNAILDINLLDDSLIEIDLLGTKVAILPDNGGIVKIGNDGSLGNGGLLDLGGLIGKGGLLDLSGLIGQGGVLDISGVLKVIIELISTVGDLDDDDLIDDDGNPIPENFDIVRIGTEGRDTFVINQNGNTYIDGLGEIDTVTFARSAEDFAFASGNNGAIFSDGTHIFYFQNVERVNFFEGSLYLDTGAGENAGVAYRLYQAAFDRAPDNAGVKFWVSTLDSGTSWKEVAFGFVESVEFRSTYGTLTNEQFVAELYENVLDRQAEGAGYTFWVNHLNNGTADRYDTLIGFSESEENIKTVGQTIDNGYAVT